MNRWICPYCSTAQVTSGTNSSTHHHELAFRGQAEGALNFSLFVNNCSNPECRKTTIRAAVNNKAGEKVGKFANYSAVSVFKQILPKSNAKQPPSCIPMAIGQDYVEANLIKDLSPKAAATLIRRCLQGMIRDFAGITRDTLFNEIKALLNEVEAGNADKAISAEVVRAIDHVRKIGNIGAHMERDVDLIIDVDTSEVQVLIELVELLFDEWYVAREARNNRLARIAEIAAEKEVQRRPGKPT